jgi:hypothetical protein
MQRQNLHFLRMMATFVVVFLSASVFQTAVVDADAAVDIRFDRIVDLSQGKEGKLRPVSVSIDHFKGEIAITESRQSAIHILNPAGIETFVTGRFSELSLPVDGSVDAQGRLVCISKIDGWNNTITRLNVYGEPETYLPASPREDWNPNHLTILRDGHYLTVDMDSGFLAKHDSISGKVIWAGFIGDGSLHDINFGRPCEMPSGDIYVPGGRQFKIFVLSAEGEFVTSFGRFGSAPGRLVLPVSVAAGPEGTVLVLDRLRHKILVFDADNKFQGEFGSLGSRPGQFYHPVSMAAGADGSIYIAQGYQGRVQVFNVLGNREN